MSKISLQALKGMDDILPSETPLWQELERRIRLVFESWHFEEIRTPLVEPVELFRRSIGEDTEIVAKEMFDFRDRGDRHITLRPEMTASVVRALVEHRLMEGRRMLGLYYWGPMYRAERPQKGRKREFYQAGCEFFSPSCPSYDVLLLTVLAELFAAIGLSNYLLKINHLGTPEERAEYVEVLKKYLSSHAGQLSEDSRRRLAGNVLRTFDSKVPQDVEIMDRAPKITDHLGRESQKGLEEVERGLRELGIRYALEPRIVRGLDYYTGLVFEVSHPALGAQDAIGAGGRYDGLVGLLGGGRTGASGFALGIERILLSLKEEGAGARKPEKLVYFGCLRAEYFNQLHALRREAARRGIATEADYAEDSIKKHLALASKLNAKASVILGENEMSKQAVVVKDMEKGEQTEVPFSGLAAALEAMLHA
jgi:histidyl-tRNA synthetase